MKNFLIIMLSLFVLMGGCQTNDTPKKETDSGLMNLSTSAPVNQDPSKHAEKKLQEKNQLKDVQAVNSNKKLLIAVQVPHNDRFQLKKIEKKLTKKAEKELPDYEVTLSLDKKIHLEVMELKQQFIQGKLGKKKLSKQINQIIKLSKEKT